jgi:spectinomycin phosphotransferase
MRQPRNILEASLRTCLRDQYDLPAVSLAFLPLGLDADASVYRVEDADGAAYLLKAKWGAFSGSRCLAPRYLRDQGITAVVAPLPTAQGALWAQIDARDDCTAILYPFIGGVTGWKPAMTDTQWEAIGTVFRQIHRAALPAENVLGLRQETFETAGYARAVRELARHLEATDEASAVEEALRASWQANLPTIYALLGTMQTLAPLLQSQSAPQVMCHGDLHPGNIIRAASGQVFIIDWDDVLLAPKERDFLFTGDPAEEDEYGTQKSAAPFFHGYGARAIDWVALTYYHCERVVQDVIECGRRICFRDDLGAEDKEVEAALFGALFTDGTMINAARLAATRLPVGLRVPLR